MKINSNQLSDIQTALVAADRLDYESVVLAHEPFRIETIPIGAASLDLPEVLNSISGMPDGYRFAYPTRESCKAPHNEPSPSIWVKTFFRGETQIQSGFQSAIWHRRELLTFDGIDGTEQYFYTSSKVGW